jgi:hypothetical protein
MDLFNLWQRVILAALMLTTAAGPALAQKEGASREALIQEVLERSGATAQIGQIPALALAGLEEQASGMEPEVYPKLVQIFSQAYRAERLEQAVRDHFEQHADEARLQKMAEWLRSRLSEKMTQLEIEASTPEAQKKMRDYAAELEWNPPPDQRLDLIARLDKAARVTEGAIEVNLATLRGIVAGLNPVLPPEKRLSEEQLREVLAGLRVQLEAPTKSQIQASLLYTYRRATQQELAEYAGFMESDLGQWFGQLISNSLLQAMSAAAEEAGKGVAETFNPPDKRT